MLEISRASLDDADAIAQCSREAYNDEIANFDHKNIFLEHPTADEVKNYIESQTYYKIKLNGDIIGGVFVFKETVHTASIEDFCISPAHQNKGYGQLILKEIERLHNDIKKWELTTPIYSVRNQYLYEKSGYTKVKIDDYGGTLCFYYEKVL